MRDNGDRRGGRLGEDLGKAHRMQHVHDVRALLSDRAAQHRAATKPRTAREIGLHSLERAYADRVHGVRDGVAGRMRRAGEHRAVMSEATELRREVEGQALDARIEAREELMCDEKNADLLRPSSISPEPGKRHRTVHGGRRQHITERCTLRPPRQGGWALVPVCDLLGDAAQECVELLCDPLDRERRAYGLLRALSHCSEAHLVVPEIPNRARPLRVIPASAR